MRVVEASRRILVSAANHYALFGMRGLMSRALSTVPGAPPMFRARIPQTTKTVLIRLGTSDVAAFEHVFINEEYGVELAEQPEVIVDAGANVGMSSIYFSNRFRSARIIAIEPDPSNFAVLKGNAKNYPRIVPVNAALWNKEGVVFMDDHGKGHWGRRTSETGGRSQTSIRSMTLPTLMSEFALEKIDFLKMDIEGAECEVLEDVRSWIDKVDVLCVELHDRFRPGCSTLFNAAVTDFPFRLRRGELDWAARSKMGVPEKERDLQ